MAFKSVESPSRSISEDDKPNLKQKLKEKERKIKEQQEVIRKLKEENQNLKKMLSYEIQSRDETRIKIDSSKILEFDDKEIEVYKENTIRSMNRDTPSSKHVSFSLSPDSNQKLEEMFFMDSSQRIKRNLNSQLRNPNLSLEECLNSMSHSSDYL
ncbi:unnamed protein product [Blepharisma stoltei]|uniref:Uncharacterized protein n=1 Tax=Blepharisma stoltei TaxID=1481888 RepID=A0AAU9JT33_9CILI|nr:unnamed protein product [Blepharisma stoltei]